MDLRRATSRVLVAGALVATLAAQGCGGAREPAHEPAHAKRPPGQIELLRQAQEKAQAQIEAEGRASALKTQREHEAVLAEAQREREGRRTHAR